MWKIRRVTTEAQHQFLASFINEHHSYIRFSDRPSRLLYWLLYEDDDVVGVFGLGSAFSQSKSVKDYMEKYNLDFNNVGNNIVYCLGNSKKKNSGSKFLSMVRKDAILWWKEKYGDDLLAFQTFILPPRTGAVYKSDNWELIGKSKGDSMQTKTIQQSEIAHMTDEEIDSLGIQRYEWKDGKVRYIQRTRTKSDPKLIFMYRNKRKRVKNLIHAHLDLVNVKTEQLDSWFS